MAGRTPEQPGERIAAFDFTQILGMADALPMLLCFIDREQRYRFVNKAFADFFEVPRSQVLGRTMAELMGGSVYEDRASLIAAAFAGERQWFAADFDHPTRGKYLTVGNPIKLSASPAEVTRSPLLGEHTDEILRDVLGYSEAERLAILESGALGAAQRIAARSAHTPAS